MTFDGTLHYKYDAWNHLTAVNADDTANPGQPGDLVATYQYDGQGHRISKTVGTGESAVTTDYLYNENWQVVQENVNGVAKYQYVWDARYIDTPICRPSLDSNGRTTQTLYYTTDANNNVTSLVDGSTGDVVERYSYDPYGKVTFLKSDWNLQDSQGSQAAGTASDYSNEILYCGYRYDPETGNFQVRNREYQPGLGVWMQRDPMEAATDLYQYVDNSPTNEVDPSGQYACTPLSRGDYADIESGALTLISPVAEIVMIGVKDKFPAIHNKMSVQAALDVGYTEANDKCFLDGVWDGASWPDMPEGAEKVYEVFNAVDEAKHDPSKVSDEIKKTLTFQSHFGDKQYYHGMASPGSDPVKVRDNIVDWVVVQYTIALYTKKPFEKGKHIGTALHTIEDTYCVAHTERVWNGYTLGAVKGFRDYGSQDPNQHKQADVGDTSVPHEEMSLAQAAARARQLLSMLHSNDDPSAVRDWMMTKVVPLAPNPYAGGNLNPFI